MEYGDKVSITERFKRIRKGTYEIIQKREPLVTDGIYLGNRVIKEGWREWDSETGWYFVVKKHISVALVSFSPTRNPVYVPLDCIK